MSTFSMPLQLAPKALYQPILPNFSINLLSVNLGRTSNAQVEEKALDQIGSYGRQIGHIAEALEVVIHRLSLLEGKDLPGDELDTLKVFLGDIAAVRKIKASLN